jgi:hypothetical protein
MTHTQGPWQMTESNDGNSRPFWTITQKRTDGTRGFSPYVASVDDHDDARLIAAAPEMAELLDSLGWTVKSYGCDETEVIPLGEAARALMDRIRGRSV